MVEYGLMLSKNFSFSFDSSFSTIFVFVFFSFFCVMLGYWMYKFTGAILGALVGLGAYLYFSNFPWPAF